MFEWLELPFMMQALVACGAMGLVLAYLGIHVVGRGIVFVDLGLGQISSMGVAYAMYAHRDPVVWSMVFTLLGAGVFASLRVHDPRLRLEAIIGIFYAVSSAVTVLLIARTPHGEADIQDVLFGNVLALDRAEVGRMLLVFAAVAVFHAALGRRFFALTYAKGRHHDLSPREHVLNLLFYVSLALAIVFAIRAGGVIPVFSYLIVPPVAAVMLARRTASVVALALLASGVATFAGLHLSFVQDFPAGASIVAVLGAVVALAAAAGALRQRRGAARVLGAAVLAALVLPPTATASDAVDLTALQAELQALKEQVRQSSERIAALELALSRAAPTPAPAPPATPAAARAGGLKLIDISLGGLFAAAASTATEEELRVLDGGGHDPKNRGFTLQNLELTLSGAVDPYVRGDASIVLQIDEEGESVVEVEEAYLTTLSLPGRLQLKAGQFFTGFGRLNPQHPHQWDFANQPVISTRLLGPDGLRGPGAQLAWLLPTPFYAEAAVGIQNAHGETAASFRGVPGEEVGGRVLSESAVGSISDLLLTGRLVTTIEPSSSFTLVPGLSWATGPNATGEGARTDIAGMDVYAKWKPLHNDHGWPFLSLQGELMARDYDAAAQVDEEGNAIPFETLEDRGGYVQGAWGFKRRWVAGLRYDWADGGDALDPLRDRRRRISPSITFYPSEFSKVRLQYDRDDADHLGEAEGSVFLQFEYLYGAHGGHKF